MQSQHQGDSSLHGKDLAAKKNVIVLKKGLGVEGFKFFDEPGT